MRKLETWEKENLLMAATLLVLMNTFLVGFFHFANIA
jgi:hypothetical protein